MVDRRRGEMVAGGRGCLRRENTVFTVFALLTSYSDIVALAYYLYSGTTICEKFIARCSTADELTRL